MPDFILPKRWLCLCITISEAERLIFPIPQICPLRLLAFRTSERSASRDFIRQAWWTFLRYPENFEGSRSWDFGCDISRMDDPIVKMYWCKWRICWVMFKLKCSIPCSERYIFRCCASTENPETNWENKKGTWEKIESDHEIWDLSWNGMSNELMQRMSITWHGKKGFDLTINLRSLCNTYFAHHSS
jgi:hypothetical protein